VVLPDTQYYSDKYPDIFSAQTDWIARNVQALDIRFVLHEGDLVDGQSSTRQWQVAQAAMTRLDGIVPYFLALGNHDFLFPQRDTTLFNRYFPYTKYRLSGHVRSSAGASYKMATGDQGNRVHQIMTNFQTWANGGNGYLKLFTIDHAHHTVSVKTYSPHLEQYLTGSRHDFVIANFRIADYIR
jgi:hypothetical protein